MSRVACDTAISSAPVPTGTGAPRAPGRPLRLCIILNTIDVGGAERQVLRLSGELRPGEVEVTVLYYGGGHALRGEFERTPARLVFLDRDRIGRPRFMWRLREFLRREDFDVVHCWHGTANQYGGVAAVLAGCRCVFMGYREFRPEPLRTRWLTSALAPFVTSRVVNSEVIRQMLARNGYPQDKLLVLHNGLHVMEADELPDPAEMRRELGFDDRPLVLNVGRLVEVKRQDLYIRMAGAVIDKGFDVQFGIVGDGPDRPALERLAGELRLADRVRFLGACRDVPAVLSCATLSVCSSAWEGLPNVVLESMMVGTPVITTDNGGGPELVDNPQQVAPLNDAGALADHVAAALSDPERLHEWALRGRRRAVEEFSIGAAARQYVEILRRAAASARR